MNASQHIQDAVVSLVLSPFKDEPAVKHAIDSLDRAYKSLNEVPQSQMVQVTESKLPVPLVLSDKAKQQLEDYVESELVRDPSVKAKK